MTLFIYATLSMSMMMTMMILLPPKYRCAIAAIAQILADCHQTKQTT